MYKYLFHVKGSANQVEFTLETECTLQMRSEALEGYLSKGAVYLSGFWCASPKKPLASDHVIQRLLL